MKKNERRHRISALLHTTSEAVSGDQLSEQFGVSRQIIVNDIAALRESGCDILSTHFGYVLKKEPKITRDFKVKHTTEETEGELTLIISLGGVVESVYVWHKVYGKIEAPLGISTDEHIKIFIAGVRSGKSTELMNITGGYHYHTVRADSEGTLDKIEAALVSGGYIVPEI